MEVMADSPQPRPIDSGSGAAEGLARSYSNFVADQAWEAEVGEVEKEPGPETGAAALANPPSLHHLLEALLFVGGAPLTAERARAAIRGLSAAPFAQAIAALNRDYRRQGRPYSIQAQGEGYCLTLRPQFRQVVERLYGQTREARLSAPAIEVLSLVAYRQPVSKQEIDSIRGAESAALIRQLVRRNLIGVVQRGESGRREVFFGTTARFLELFQLSSLDDLPQTADLQKL
jgi:segregation and condensation protein B